MKKYALLLLLLYSISHISRAQNAPNSDNNSILNALIDSAVVLLTTEYVLRDTAGEVWGKGNNEYYDRSYYLGIISEGGLHLPPSAVSSWTFDKSILKSDLKNGLLQPTLSNIRIAPFPYQASDEVALVNLDTLSRTIVEGSTLLNTKMAIAKNTKKGTLSTYILMYNGKNALKTGAKTTLKSIFFQKQVTLDSTNQDIVIDIPYNSDFVGGVVLQPQIKAGNLQLMVVGLIYSDESTFNKQYKMCRLRQKISTELKKVQKKIAPKTSEKKKEEKKKGK